jgi:hypothetical protein
MKTPEEREIISGNGRGRYIELHFIKLAEILNSLV